METTISGSVESTPGCVNESTAPSGVSIAEFSTTHAYAVQTGLMVRSVSSPGSFVALEGSGTVTQGAVFYMRVNAPVTIEITQDSTTRELVVNGVTLIEFDTQHPATLFRIKGVAKVEYFLAGLL